MTTTLQAAQDCMFQVMEDLCAAVHDVCVLDPGIDTEQAARGLWLRADGTSVGFEQTKPNELTFTLQVTMDAILAVPDDTDPDELLYKGNL